MKIVRVLNSLFKEIVSIVLLLTCIPAHAIVIGNISGTFDTDYIHAPVSTDATDFLSPLLGGSFLGSYTLASMPTSGSWPSVDSWAISFFDASANLVSTMSSMDPGNTVDSFGFGDGSDDSLFFRNLFGEGPSIQLIFPDNFLGNGDIIGNSNVAWYDGSSGAYFGEIQVVSGSSVISSVPEPGTVALLGLGLLGLGFARRRHRA